MSKTTEKSIFDASLDALRADDIAPAPKKTRGGFDAVRTVALVACIAVFCVCIFMIAQNLIDYKRASDLYGNLAQGVSGERVSGTAERSGSPIYSMTKLLSSLVAGRSSGDGAASVNVENERMRSTLSELKIINDDIYGWIYIDGTKISLPVTRGEDNKYYLDHAYNGEFLKAGTIFADYRNAVNIAGNRNTVFYGHNMANGEMFHDLEKFLDEDYFNDTLITVYTLDGIYTYMPFSIYSTRANYNYFKTDFESDEEFLEFANEMYDNSKFESEGGFTKDDKLLTLSTCTNFTISGRYALHARLVGYESY